MLKSNCSSSIANTVSEYAQNIELQSQPKQIINRKIKEIETRIKNQNDQTQPFIELAQSINSKKSDQNKEINLSKPSSHQQHAKSKLIFDSFDDDKKFEQKLEQTSIIEILQEIYNLFSKNNQLKKIQLVHNIILKEELHILLRNYFQKKYQYLNVLLDPSQLINYQKIG